MEKHFCDVVGCGKETKKRNNVILNKGMEHDTIKEDSFDVCASCISKNSATELATMLRRFNSYVVHTITIVDPRSGE